MDPAIQGAMQAMHQQHQQQAAEIQQLHAGIAAMQQQLNVGAAAAAAPRPARERLAVVPDYTGVTGGLEEWIKLMERQFDFYGTVAEADRCRSAAGHLLGPALDWWNGLAAGARPANWANFRALLALRFQPITAVEAARTKLFALRQGPSSVNKYVGAFQNLAAFVPGTDPATLRHLFTNGLNPEARKLVAVANINVLEDIMAMAVRIGAVAEAPASAHTAMDLGAIGEATPESATTDLRTSIVADVLAALNMKRGGKRGPRADGDAPRAPPVIKGLTESQVKTYMADGRCFGCGELGHSSRQCPSRKVVDGKVVWKTSK